MDLLNDAKSRMLISELSCFAYLKIGTYTSKYTGIRPLLQPLNIDKHFFEDAFVIDKVIGKSAAFLLIYGKAKKVHAMIMSEHAKKLLDDYGFDYSYDTLVPFIQNNLKTSMCTMENVVLNIDNVDDAIVALNKKIDDLMILREL